MELWMLDPAHDHEAALRRERLLADWGRPRRTPSPPAPRAGHRAGHRGRADRHAAAAVAAAWDAARGRHLGRSGAWHAG